jgi:hypothetical protein
MLIHSEPFFDNTRIEIVNGDDIMLSYKNNSKTSSCMSILDRWKRQKFWSNVPGCNLIRVMDSDDVLLLRAFLWEANDESLGKKIKYLDKFYYKSYTADYCFSKTESHPKVHSEFSAVWNKFADVLSSAHRLTLDVLDGEAEEYPMTDNFRYLSKDKTKIANKPFLDGSYILVDHVSGKLMI